MDDDDQSYDEMTSSYGRCLYHAIRRQPQSYFLKNILDQKLINQKVASMR